jgi:hypothetical protein
MSVNKNLNVFSRIAEVYRPVKSLSQTLSTPYVVAYMKPIFRIHPKTWTKSLG